MSTAPASAVSVAVTGGARRPPGPRGWSLLRDLRQMRTDRLAVVMRALQQYGGIAEFRAGPRCIVLVSDPDAVRGVLVEREANYVKGLGLADARPLLGDGLLTSEGALWATRRPALQRAFHAERLSRFADAVVAAAYETASRWERASDGSAEIATDMMRLALVAFGHGFLDADLTRACDGMIRAFAIIERWAMRRGTAIASWPLWMPTVANVRVRVAIRSLESWASALIEERRGRPTATDDLVTAFLQLHEVPDKAARAARDELLTLLLAGHETTGAALAWTALCLAQHPDVARGVVREVEDVLGDRAPGLADVSRLPFTRSVVEEALRLYPPVWLIPRRALASHELSGYRIRAGTDVLISVFALHRHPAVWRDPDAFDATRFLNDTRGPGTYLPFGIGPRACLGSRLALTEAILVTAVLVRRFRFCAPPGPVHPNPALTLQFPTRVSLIATRR